MQDSKIRGLILDLVYAARDGKTPIIRSLLERRIDVNAEGTGTTALHQAAGGGHIEAMRLLLDFGADTTADEHGATALAYAIRNPQAVRLLIERGADVNFKEQEYQVTYLMEAAEDGNIVVVQMLLDAGTDVNARDYKDRTALTYARFADNADIVELLRSVGAEDGTVSTFEERVLSGLPDGVIVDY